MYLFLLLYSFPPSVWACSIKLNSSPRPELFSSRGLLLETPRSAQPPFFEFSNLQGAVTHS